MYKSKITSLALAAALTVSLAACGGASGAVGSSGGAGNGGSAGSGGGTVRVGTIPNASDVAIYLGNSQGFFKKQGVTVVPKTATGFAPNLAAVVNGESQVGFAALIPILVAISKGAPIKVIAGADVAPKTYDAATDPDNVFTKPGSGITKPTDLQGKTVAVTALGSIQDLGTKIAVKNAGGDPSKVRFLVLPSADMIAALESGRVDAVALSEPFTSAAHKQGLKSLFSYATSPMPGLPVGAYFTSTATLSKEGATINKFVAGLDAATQFAQANPDKVRAALPTYTKIKPEVATAVHTFPYQSKISADQIDALSKLLQQFGYTTKPIDAKAVTP